MDLSHRPKSFLGAAMALTAVLSTIGCTSLSLNSRTGPKAEVEVTGMAPPLSNPLRAYGQDPTVISALARAVDILTEECMEGFGFDYQLQDYGALDRSFLVDDTRLYGITDEVAAEQFGYLPAPSRSAEDSPPQVTALYQFVLTGLEPTDNPAELDLAESPGSVAGDPVPPGGCLGQARLELTGSVTERPSPDAELGHLLYGKAWNDAWTSPATEEAKAVWSDCMEESGYEVGDPLDDVALQTGLKPSDSEVQIALTDIACKKSTDFVSKANAENVRVAQNYLDENQLDLQASKDFNENALAKANAVIDAAQIRPPQS